MPTEKEVLAALSSIQDPDLGRDIVSLGFIKDLGINGDRVSFTIELTTPACPVKEHFKSEAARLVGALPGVGSVDVNMSSRVRGGPPPAKPDFLTGVRNVIPVASGKGGVGKSTVSANIAAALAKTGAKVGLMDLDVYGPSIPAIMGINGEIRIENEKVIPPVAHGVKVVSMGFFMREGEAMVWRGPMLHRVAEQFLGDVTWGELDYLIVDFPPGTGDVQMSLCQLATATGAVIVSTPQDVALAVARKAIDMFSKLKVPVLGLIENMSHFICPSCGHREEIFGAGGVAAAAKSAKLPFLGEVPLAPPIRRAGDAGAPIVVAEPESAPARAFVEIAARVAAQASVRGAGAR